MGYLLKLSFLLLFVVNVLGIQSVKAELTGKEIVDKSYDAWRGANSSEASMTMRVVRPNRTEEMSLNSWSKGDNLSMSKFIAPAKYKGQGVLVNNDSMWTYSSKSKRSMKIANSLKSQSWMGSDLSYDDVSRSKESVDFYEYKLIKTENKGDRKHYYVEAVPLKDAPVVWGKEVWVIDDRFLLVKHEFYDQENKLVRVMECLEVASTKKGQLYAKHIKVTNMEKEGYYTEFINNSLEFDVKVSDSFFSLTNLEKP